MAQQTAMTKLLKWVRDTLPMDLDTPIMIERKIESLIEIEKEQIIETWKHGNLPTFLGRTLTAEEYYKETYGK
jgi:hypothetical protein